MTELSLSEKIPSGGVPSGSVPSGSGRRALVTGGAGFLGSHLCRTLLNREWEVIAADNFITGRASNVKDIAGNPRFTLLETDVSGHIDVPGPLDAVLHFASPASPKDYLEYPIETLLVGSRGTHNALGLARAKGARFLVASTSEIYGDPLVHPQTESYWGNVNSIGPRSVYDEAKRFAEAMTMAYRRTFGVDTKIVRIFNTYGPYLRPGDGRAIPNFMVQAMANKPLTIFGDGSQTRSFCFVDDEIRGLLALLESDISGPVNIGNPDEFTILELAKQVIEVTGSKSELVYESLPTDDPTRRRPDISLAKLELGWSPEIDLRQGLIRTYEWFLSESEQLGA